MHLTLAELLYMHSRLLERYGGCPGIRDRGLLESALARPKSGYYTTLSQQAAALMQSLALNHAFADANKRMAFTACATFLRVNGFRLVASADEAERFIVEALIGARTSLQEVTQWIEAHMQALPG
ncbi:MAG: type II toxin-antitoxin system death-on-curing family toxin [Polyangiales bacterium]